MKIGYFQSEKKVMLQIDWESNCIEQSSVWADLNEFRFILDIHNEVRVILGEKDRLAPIFSCVFYFLPSPLQITKTGVVPRLWEPSMSLPLSQLCLASFSPQPQWGVSFLIEQSLQYPLSLKTKHQLGLLPHCLFHFQSPDPVRPHQSLIKTLPKAACFPLRASDGALPVVDDSLLERLWNLAFPSQTLSKRL